jgi:hypothetical protein
MAINQHPLSSPGFFLAELGISCILSVNMLFTAVDISVCSNLLDNLTTQVVNKTLTTHTLNKTREEIEQRVHHSLYMNTSMIIVALINIIVILIELLFAFKVYSQQDTYIHLLLFVKELPFLYITFMKSAGINEQADKLVTLLGTSEWGNEPNNMRLSLYVNAESRKISFPLAGMRLTKRDVYMRFGAWFVALIFSVFRLLVLRNM